MKRKEWRRKGKFTDGAKRNTGPTKKGATVEHTSLVKNALDTADHLSKMWMNEFRAVADPIAALPETHVFDQRQADELFPKVRELTKHLCILSCVLDELRALLPIFERMEVRVGQSKPDDSDYGWDSYGVEVVECKE